MGVLAESSRKLAAPAGSGPDADAGAGSGASRPAGLHIQQSAADNCDHGAGSRNGIAPSKQGGGEGCGHGSPGGGSDGGSDGGGGGGGGTGDGDLLATQGDVFGETGSRVACLRQGRLVRDKAMDWSKARA